MRILHFFITGTFFLCLTACNDSIDSALFTLSPLTEVSFSRSVSTPENLPEGSVVLFNAQGALNASDCTLTYSGEQWESEEPLQWNESTETSIYTALYPVYDEKTFCTDNLYNDTQLTDILIAQDTLENRSNIDLSFQHLFSQLTIHVSSSYQEQLQEIRLTVPETVSTISTTDGNITTTADEHTTVLSVNETGSYTFILPPMQNALLSIELITPERNYSAQLQTHTFESNTQYECKLRGAVGILDADDLIAFSLLINGRSYSGEKTLDDFGCKTGNDTVYYLLADITLTDEECEQLLPIGYNTTYAFNHTFEGNNHIISNLTVPDKSVNSTVQSQYSGLFGYLSSHAIVRNLHLTHATSVDSPTCKQTGILAAESSGRIIHCSVGSSSIVYGENTTAQGFICANSNGYIINCHSYQNTLKVGSNSKSGGIAGNTTGYVLNCYAYGNTFTTKNSSYTGGIAGMSNINLPLVINNCYVYHTATYSNFGAIIGYARAATIDQVFYNSNSVYSSTNNSTVTNSYKYDSNFQVDGISIAEYLNEWIDTAGKNIYPDITFIYWKTNDDNTVTFQ